MEVDLEVKRSWILNSNRVRDEPRRLKIPCANSRAASSATAGAGGDAADRRTYTNAALNNMDVCVAERHINNLGGVYVRLPSLSVTQEQHFAEEPVGFDFYQWGSNPSDYLIGLRKDRTGSVRVYVRVCVCVFCKCVAIYGD